MVGSITASVACAVLMGDRATWCGHQDQEIQISSPLCQCRHIAGVRLQHNTTTTGHSCYNSFVLEYWHPFVHVKTAF